MSELRGVRNKAKPNSYIYQDSPVRQSVVPDITSVLFPGNRCFANLQKHSFVSSFHMKKELLWQNDLHTSALSMWVLTAHFLSLVEAHINFSLGKRTSCPRYITSFLHCLGVPRVAVVWRVVALCGDVEATGKYIRYGVVEVEKIEDFDLKESLFWYTVIYRGNRARYNRGKKIFRW